MGKRRTLRERATDWVETVTPHEMASAESFAIAAYEAGARSTRISAAQRRVVEAVPDAAASLAAAISLLERGGRKAAPSDKMFDQMLADYRQSLEQIRDAWKSLERAKGDRK
jgi:hypothetical protein